MRIRVVPKGMASTENILTDRGELADALPNLKKCPCGTMFIQQIEDARSGGRVGAIVKGERN
ncbi:MAG TPA: hypothetical protein VG322_05745 [Candidatus Acidoferrales bacterium]|nr:hypothetical protein [Candidatus Acidoferrales bacterium]